MGKPANHPFTLCSGWDSFKLEEPLMMVDPSRRLGARVALGAPVAMLLAASGGPCSSPPPSSAQRVTQPQLEFRVVGTAQTAGPDSVAVTAITADTVALVGTMSAPNPCYRIEPSLASEGDSVQLSLAATARPLVCPQVLVTYRYEVRITGLAPGTYALAVTYAYPNTGWQRRVFRLTAEVPAPGP